MADLKTIDEGEEVDVQLSSSDEDEPEADVDADDKALRRLRRQMKKLKERKSQRVKAKASVKPNMLNIEIREKNDGSLKELEDARLNLKALRTSSGISVVGLLISAGLAFGALIVVQPLSLVMLAWFVMEIIAVVSCVCFFLFNWNAFRAIEVPKVSRTKKQIDQIHLANKLSKQEARCKRSMIAMLVLMAAEIVVGLETLNVIVFNLADISGGNCDSVPDGVFTSWTKLPVASQALFICICIFYSITVMAQGVATVASYRLHIYYSKQLHRASPYNGGVNVCLTNEPDGEGFDDQEMV